MHRKVRFINNIWIIGTYNEAEILGRTFKMNNLEVVAFVNENGELKRVAFRSIDNIKKLAIVKKVTPKISAEVTKKKNKSKSEIFVEELLKSINFEN